MFMHVETLARSVTPPMQWLDRGEILVAVCDLEMPASTVRTAMQALNDEERGRAMRFVAYRDRRRFVMSHFALRRFLSAACGMPASKLCFATEPLGRPFLLSPPGLDFNMSHAGETAAYALSGQGRVGIDIENTMTLAAAEELARHVLAPEELSVWQQAPSQTRTALFLRYWCAKEAFLKLHGTGFSVEPQAVVANLDRGIVECQTPRLDSARVVWWPVGANAMCALATRDVVRIREVSSWLVGRADGHEPDTASRDRASSWRQRIGTDSPAVANPSLSCD